MNNLIAGTYFFPEVMAFYVNGSAAGSAVLAGPDASLATLTVNGTGDYSITLTETANKLLYCFAPVSQTADKQLSMQAAGTTKVLRILSRSIGASPAASDADFSVMILVQRQAANFRAPGGAL